MATELKDQKLAKLTDILKILDDHRVKGKDAKARIVLLQLNQRCVPGGIEAFLPATFSSTICVGFASDRSH